MSQQQDRVGQSFRRVEGWWGANTSYVVSQTPDAAPAISVHLDTLHGIVDRLTGHVTALQTERAQTLLISKDERELRKELLTHHMATIVEHAKALRGRVPGIGILTMPKGNTPSAALITAASVMARQAEIYRSVLVESGLPTDFIEQLEAGATAVKDSLDARGLARGARTAAARGIETELAFGRRVVWALNAIVKRATRRNPVKFAEWRHVQRVVQRATTPRAASTATENGATGEKLTPTPAKAAPTVVQGAPTVVQSAPTAAQGGATVVQGGPIVPIAAPTLVQDSPTPANSSPTEADVTPTVREKAA